MEARGRLVLIPLPVWHKHGVPTKHTPPRPLDEQMTERLALRYVERFATTRAKLADYLRRKLRERGHVGMSPDPDRIADRMVELGYVNDRLFAEVRAGAMARKGLGARRVHHALRQAGIAADDLEPLEAEIEERTVRAALTFARKRRIGPYSAESKDPDLRRRQVAAMVRAGHSPSLAWKIVSSDPDGWDESLFDAS